MRSKQLRQLALGALLALAAAVSSVGEARADTVLIFAAASLKNALDDAIAAAPKVQGRKIVVSYAASSALAKGIENGATADIFISADLDWMDYLQTRNLINAATRKNVLGNHLVLIAPAASKVDKVEIKPGFALLSLLGSDRLAMADPDSVPAGKYGKAALEKLGVWASVADHVARAENVRAALLFVSRGETPLGIVYQTDAVSDKGVKVVGTFPEDSHPPIVYPIALTAASKSADAKPVLEYLESPAARGAYEKQGFSILP